VYILDSGVKVEVVVGYGNYLFCSKCSRIRLTPDGYLRPCLYVEQPRISIVEQVKTRNREELIKALVEIVLLRKPFSSLRGSSMSIKMIDITSKPVSYREATATGFIKLKPETIHRIKNKLVEKEMY